MTEVAGHEGRPAVQVVLGVDMLASSKNGTPSDPRGAFIKELSQTQKFVVQYRLAHHA